MTPAERDGAAPRQRTRRTAVRSDAAAVRLVERDGWLLEALAKMRFLTTTHIARLFFNGSRSAANKRLRGLFNARLVRVWVRTLHADNVYSLTPRGRDVLHERAEACATSIHCPRKPDGQLEHLLGINTVRVALAVTLPEANGEMTSWRSDWELRAERRERVIPDALLGVRWDGRLTQSFSLEVEHESKSPRGFAKKMLRYAAHSFAQPRLYGSSDFAVLVVGHDARWMERYRSTIMHVAPHCRVWFTMLHELQAKGPVNKIWQGVCADEKYSLREAGSLPYRNNGQELENGAFPTGSAPAPARIYLHNARTYP